MFNTDFVFASKFDMQNALDNVRVKVFIDTTQIDSMLLFSGKGFGTGTTTVTFKSGLVRYMVKGNSDLEAILNKFGAVNDSVADTVTVPLRIQVGNKRYGGDATFFYKATADKMGSGK